MWIFYLGFFNFDLVIGVQSNQNDGDAQYGKDAGEAIDVEEVT